MRVGILRKLYVIWNRGYKSQMVIAESASEALQLSMESGHFKRLNNYRKFLDCTEEYSGRPEYANLEKALNAGVSGVAMIVGGVWSIGGTALT